ITEGGILNTGTVNITGMPLATGTLNIGAIVGSPLAAAGTLNASNVAFGLFGGTINFNHTDTDYEFGTQISGNGTINAVAGTTVLTGDNTLYTGNIFINAGTLVAGSNTAFGAGNVTVFGGTLGYRDGVTVNNAINIGLIAGSATLEVATGTATQAGQITGMPGVLVTKTGAGTLVLTSDNPDVGSVFISAGRLQLGDGGTSGSISAVGPVVNNGVLTFNRSDEVTFANAIFGSGAVEQNGTGTTILSGINGYSGGTVLNAGTLQISSDSNLGTIGVGGLTFNGGTLRNTDTISLTRSVTLNAAGGTFDTAADLTLMGGISGDGGLTKTGAGTLTLSGLSTYTGATTITAGVLAAAAPGSLGSNSAVTVQQGATLRVGGGQMFSWVDAGSLAGSGTLDLQAGSIFNAGSNNASTVFAGTVTGSGSLLKWGTGTMTLTGNSTSGVSLLVQQGGIDIDGGSFSTTAATDIFGEGAQLRVRNGGTLQTGQLFVSGGTMLIDGPGSSVTATNSTQVGGALTISNGATLTSNSGAGVGGYDVPPVVTVTGQGSTWIVTGGLNIGTSFMPVLFAPGPMITPGIVTVLDGGSVSVIDGTTVFAGSTLNVGNGSTLQTGELSVNGTMAIDGPGSSVTATGSTSIAGGLTITNRATLASNGGASVGGYEGLPVATVTGQGSTWTITGELAIGASLMPMILAPDPMITPGVVTVADGGSVSATGGTTIFAGSTLNLGTGGLAGTIVTPQITNDGQIVASFTDTLTLATPISGTGSLTKSGAGTLILTGSSTYSGPTTVDGGRLAVNGSIASTVTVNASGTLGGSGTIGGFIAASGGTIAPGNSIGTLNVAGNATFAAGSTYLVEIDPANNADRIVASGTAALDGTVRVEKAGGVYTAGSRYTILTANTGITGTFADMTQSTPLLNLALAYDNNNVYLDITRNAVSFCDVAATRNQCASGRAAESLGAGNPVHDAIASLPDQQSVRQAFDLVSGEIHASAASTLVEEAHHLRDAVTGRLRQGYGSAVSLASLTAAAPSANLTGQSQATDTVIAAWTQAIGAWGKQRADGNAASVSRSLGGFLIGVDATFDQTWRVGLAAGYTRSSFDSNARSSNGSSDNYHLALYGGGQLGAVGLRAGASMTWHSIDTSRRVAFPGVADTLKADYSARTAQLFAEAGYALAFDRSAVEPFAGIAWLNHHTGRINESGTVAALSGGRQSFDMGFSTLGLRAATTLNAGDKTPVTLRATLGWRHAFGDVTPETRLAFRTGGNPFTTAGAPIARDSFITEAGVDIDVASYARLGISYSGQFASKAYEHAVKGSVSLRF
ncbi:autotransporter outer membrane beta-barrel domain-containing protein, partial [Vineibacter terrae]|uniref:autotransporter outer membrane beta-barrel domain-containing protein n=1 Tax=Vineibacter terrae TaxID=2586908 RepID=UPI002E364CFE